ncbi:MAG: hypothetical protein LHW64_06800 [Candidatus Cloacimonetes bacterium]|jgi:hypothetical protein|nr:hypothetical protein [Candidatus Cloacimonadota bacterium]MCB5287494.1 hypothetical protein [Candidatus Cloacimonadota bacterium]MCK9185259.1 hypothetical protein [Candidatus Cloacimonadota bacterium]MDY0229815.1 hypothetical protein [Candidatus Cloacimonadaceae bacterium]
MKVISSKQYFIDLYEAEISKLTKRADWLKLQWEGERMPPGLSTEETEELVGLLKHDGKSAFRPGALGYLLEQKHKAYMQWLRRKLPSVEQVGKFMDEHIVITGILAELKQSLFWLNGKGWK